VVASVLAVFQEL
jgi:hypothetical protein